MRNKSITKGITKKSAVITVIAAAAAIAMSITAYAWFTNQRRLDVLTKVNAPTPLSIGAGAKEDSVNIDMGGIDTEGESRKKDFVFCVFSDTSVGEYKIQLAHTTNIGFKYKIYKSEEINSAVSSSVLYTDTQKNAHYYKIGDELSGSYLNLNESAQIAAVDSYHEKSYGAYGNVQENAEPLYWQSGIVEPAGSDGSSFVDYYILEVSWDDTVKNDKETDIIYITAGMS